MWRNVDVRMQMQDYPNRDSSFVRKTKANLLSLSKTNLASCFFERTEESQSISFAN